MSVPIVINQDAVAITATTATLKGSLEDTGGLPTVVTIFYGLTDGGTTAANWDNSFVVGAVAGGDYIAPVTGLLPSHVYFYTSRAVNSDGEAWVVGFLSGSASFWFGTLGVASVVPDAQTGARLEAHYRDDWVTSPDASVNKGNVKWAAPICPKSFQLALIGLSNPVSTSQPGTVLTCYACASAGLTFDYNKIDATHFHFDQTWSSNSRASYSPNNQSYNPYVTGKGVRVSVTPLYQGEIGVATEAWMLTKGVWKLHIDTWINPILPQSDGVNYRLRIAAQPRRVNGVESEAFNDVISSGNDSRTVTVDLRGVCFWTIFVTLGANARDSGIPDNTHLCSINVTASRSSGFAITTELGDYLYTEDGQILEIEHV